MNLVSLLIAPLQAVVLFFAPHAGSQRPGAPQASTGNPTKPSLVRQRMHAHGMAQRPAAQKLPANVVSLDNTASDSVASASPAARTTYPQRQALVTAMPIHRVRVVRNVDNSLPADRAGRMCVSGRFADVCAELDRLVAQQMRTA